ncbi:hypothetical protein ACEY2D_011595, partial [Neisseria gonorrhoeae]
MILKSRTRAAEAFEEWVRETVLPAIRKTGGCQSRPKNHRRRPYRNAPGRCSACRVQNYRILHRVLYDTP